MQNLHKTMKIITKYIDNIKFVFYVGQNAQENFDIIDASKSHDLWFHIEAAPSCHVIAELDDPQKYNKKQLHKIAVQGAVLCKQYSRFCSDKNVVIIYCPISCVEKQDMIGSVSVNKYKKIII